MNVLALPKRTEVGRVIPKNSFDEYTNTNQKKLIANKIKKISWSNKLSTETTNLKSESVKEIQIFNIELKQKDNLKKILDIFDKSIPYHIVFTLIFNNEILLSTSAKHDHLTKANELVLDCTFRSNWLFLDELEYKLELKESLDQTFISFCNQISKRSNEYKTYHDFVEAEKKIKRIENQIIKLENQIKKEKQFNKKVILNIELNKIKQRLTNTLK